MKKIIIACVLFASCSKKDACVVDAKLTEIGVKKYRMEWNTPGKYSLDAGPGARAGYGTSVEFYYDYNSANHLYLKVIADCGTVYEKQF